MKINKIVSIITLITCNVAIFQDLVKAEQTVTDISGKIKLYELPANLGDGVSSLLGIRNKKYVSITPEGLVIDKYSTIDNGDGTVKVTMDVYNPYFLDGFVEIRNSQGKVVSSEKSVDAFKLPENWADSIEDIGRNYWTVVNPANFTAGIDPTTDNLKYKKTNKKIEFTLKKGDSANLTVGSPDAIKYNTISLLFDCVGLFIDIGGLRDKGGKDKLALDFITNSKYKTVTTLWKDWMILIDKVQSEDISAKDKVTKITSNPLFTIMSKEVTDYIAETGGEISIDVLKSGASDVIQEGVNSLSAPVAATAEVTYIVAKSTNVFKKGMHISKFIKFTPQPIALTVQDEKYGRVDDYSQQNPNNSVQTSILQNQLAGITQSNVSHIGSASTNFVRNPIQNKVTEQNAIIAEAKPQTIQEKNQYTNGQIIRTPFDITLTWNQNGSNPLDLDSHLATPNGEHLYFPRSERGNLNSSPNAFLYRDSIPPNEPGAEQTRVTKLQDGEYRFYVHNYTDTGPSGNTFSPNRLSNSSAQVKIFEGGKPLTNIPNDPNNYNKNDPGIQAVGNAYPNGTFNVPTNTPGNTWSVFRLNARTGILTPVNTFGNASSSDVPKLR